MNFVRFCVFLVFVVTINSNISNVASLPTSGNATAVATRSSTAIMDVFDDIKWFFERLTIFCDLVEKMLPPERKERIQPHPSVGLNLQNGIRHFVFGVREISKSVVRVVSDKDIQEYKQLSQATDFAHDLVKSVGDFFKNLRFLVGKLFAYYTFYIPEVLLTKCMGTYLVQTYPHRPMYEYPIILINEVIDSFRTPMITHDSDMLANETDGQRKFSSGTHINFDRNVEQNEISDDDMYVFHNTPVSPTPELADRIEDTPAEKDSSIFNAMIDQMGFKSSLDANLIVAPTWKKCAQIYATETIFRKLELYFLIK